MFGHCVYKNRFSDRTECREYRGDRWDEVGAGADCRDWGAELEGGACEFEDILGACVLGDPERVIRVVVPGADAGDCRQQERGCEIFGGGIFVPAPVCGGEDLPDPVEGTVFQWPVLECRQPLAGEPAGQGEGGDVCTWSMISGCTEPGRDFAAYAACDMVRTQRPYSAQPSPQPEVDDPRLADLAYAEELAWVTEQVSACACVCCHQSSITPEGAAIWDLEAPGNWVNSFTPYGLAFAGGFLDSSLLGAYPAADNNGFDRASTGLPTTDPERMAAFFAAELEHRGLSPADFADADPTPAPFYQQYLFEPQACAGDEGVAADGTMIWEGGSARYVYVLAADAPNPGVPPNLDLPEGTVWRVEVPWDSAPMASRSVRYGELPEGASQGFPADGSPPTLEAGDTYYLYVLADIGVPITRCLFTYSG
ncbi:proteinase inhibitor [Nannocystis punicea]|uniref:Proteinase inhibitor n=1 Tax=Nannocystis punicea TaxID=2995304 RepID=A0ABY7H1R4_9BACT|nr:proteinase inhibitor [Nannocystis poenicansa]WAS93123.1 proteinase inhibitor [Nannocystis poenicansa]